MDLEALAKGSFKRLAWAYASSRKGSEEEAVLERLLRDRVLAESGPRPEMAQDRPTGELGPLCDAWTGPCACGETHR